MDKDVIITCGTSIIRNLKEMGLKPEHKDIFNKLSRSFIQGLTEDVSSLSAELSTFELLNLNNSDTSAFITTDTDLGTHAALLVKRICEIHFDISVEIKTISGLNLNNIQQFKRDGLSQLIDTLDYRVENDRNYGRSPIISISGGIKPVIPYISVYSMLRCVPLTYVFEKTRELITLPGLPIEFDFSLLSTIEKHFKELDEKACVSKSRLINVIGPDTFSFIEGLFDDAGNGKITPSIFGMMLFSDIEKASKSKVFLSITADKNYSRLNKKDQNSFDLLLERVKNPFWRSSKLYKFEGTDLNVWKPGNTAHRIAGWVENEQIYIAALYESHDFYERDLNGRKRNQYDIKTFVEWRQSIT